MKKVSRREFLKFSAIAGAAAVLPLKFALREAYAQYGLNSPSLQKFIQPLRSIGGIAGVFNAAQQAIPVAGNDGTRAWGTTSATHYTVNIGPFSDQLHPSLPPTALLGFHPANVLAGNATPMHLGGVIAALKNAPVQITFRNNLPPTHILPVDTTIPGANQAHNRTAVHMHGGFVPWISDGGPFDWWAPDGTHGLSFLNNEVLRPAEFVAGTIPANEAEYYYPNGQSARLVWYHDHAWGITRLNAYAGIATGYVITDTAAEEAFVVAQGVPGPLDPRTFYLIFQDKVFNANGSLFYANIYDPALFGPAGIPSFTGGLPAAFPLTSVVPEFFGDTVLVNGTVYPYVEVQPRRYRFRMLNACNSRFLNPRLVYARSNVLTNVDSTEPRSNAPGPSFLQIGTEGGFLPAPVLFDGKPNSPKILMAPAERADVIVDFSAVPVGSVLILYNNAPGPFPGGGRIFDYYPGNPKSPTATPGFGPNTRTLLQFRVVAPTPPADTPLTLTLPLLDPPALVNQVPGVPNRPVISRAAGTARIGAQTYPLRQLTLNEGFDQYGRLAQYIGTNTPTMALVPGAVAGFFGQRYVDEAATEVMVKGATEVWEIANLTADTHPLHFHLVNVQVLARQPFNAKAYNGTPSFMGMPVAPDANELGWKETVRMNPGEVIWVIMKFDLPVVPFNVPTSPRVAATTDPLKLPVTVPAGTTANEYVWHCHILEHEEHDMMRPVVVLGQNPWEQTGTSNSTVSFTFFGFGTAPYTISASAGAPVPAPNAFLTDGGTFNVSIPVGATVGTIYTYTITDSTIPTARTVIAQLKVV
jgi:spore coat protein A